MSRLAPLACCMALCVLAGAAGDAPRVVYSKYFKGSQPEYTAILVERSGEAVYKEAPDDDNPIRFRLAEAAARAIFDLAEKLDRFKRPVESGLKVAQMGVKTFRFEDGAGATEVKFNYSEDPDARALADWFDRIAETERHWIDLDRAVHFDKLGVNQAILETMASYDRKRLVAPEQFLALLDRIVANESFLHIARERAAQLAEAIRSPRPRAEETR